LVSIAAVVPLPGLLAPPSTGDGGGGTGCAPVPSIALICRAEDPPVPETTGEGATACEPRPAPMRPLATLPEPFIDCGGGTTCEPAPERELPIPDPARVPAFATVGGGGTTPAPKAAPPRPFATPPEPLIDCGGGTTCGPPSDNESPRADPARVPAFATFSGGGTTCKPESELTAADPPDRPAPSAAGAGGTTSAMRPELTRPLAMLAVPNDCGGGTTWVPGDNADPLREPVPATAGGGGTTSATKPDETRPPAAPVTDWGGGTTVAPGPRLAKAVPELRCPRTLTLGDGATTSLFPRLTLPDFPVADRSEGGGATTAEFGEAMVRPDKRVATVGAGATTDDRGSPECRNVAWLISCAGATTDVGPVGTVGCGSFGANSGVLAEAEFAAESGRRSRSSLTSGGLSSAFDCSRATRVGD
jgi:hypothetical protein